MATREFSGLPEPSEEHLERIVDALWALGAQPGDHEGVWLLDVEYINNTNHVLTGYLYHESHRHDFTIEMGDITGCVVKEWGCCLRTQEEIQSLRKTGTTKEWLGQSSTEWF